MLDDSERQKKTGIFIGRFQPFHSGHWDALGQMSKQVDGIKILIGSSNMSNTPENPFTFRERKAYMRSCGVKYPILPLPDNPSDEIWCDKLLRHLNKNTIVFSANNYVLKLLKKSRIPHVPLKIQIKISATEIREALRKNKMYEEYLIRPLPKKMIDKIKKTG